MGNELQPLKLGAVGVGGIYRAHANNLKLMGGNQVVAFCDMNEVHRSMADEAGGRFYTDVAAMLEAEPDLDALISCTPPVARRAVVQAAADFSERNGRPLPVFVEKPPAFSLDDARFIAGVVKSTGLPVFVGFMYRYLPVVDRVKELLEGRPIHLVQSSFFCPALTKWNLPAWFAIKERSGGHILDQAVHSIDLIRYLAGDITKVQTFGNNILKTKSETMTIEESSSTNLRFASGASGAHIHSWSHDEFKVSVGLIGADFHLKIDLDSHLTGFVGDLTLDETFCGPPEGASHHYAEMVAFLAAVRAADFAALRSPYLDAAKSLATVLAMNQSIESGAVETVSNIL